MPTYTFYNTKTKTEYTEFMSIAAMEELLATNKNLTLKPSAPFIADSVRIGVTKPPADFMKGVIGRIKDKHGKGAGALERRYHIPKEI